MTATNNQIVMDFSQITTMTEQDIIANFGRVSANIDELFNRVVNIIMPVVDRVTAAEEKQVKAQEDMNASIKAMTGLEERLRVSVNPIITQWDDVKTKVSQYELELGRNAEAHRRFQTLIEETKTSVQRC